MRVCLLLTQGLTVRIASPQLLVDKSDTFSANARAFQKDSSGLRRAMWWKNMRMIAIMMSLLLGVGATVLWFKCGWMLKQCRHS